MNKIFLCLAMALIASSVVGEHFSYKFTLPTNLVTLGSAVVNETLQLTEFPGEAGLVYYPGRALVNVSFATEFTWIPTDCDTMTGGGDGYVKKIVVYSIEYNSAANI
jgi:hypothetical protein